MSSESTVSDALEPGPLGGSGRIVALDVARGFALLGILFVNASFFSEPLGRVMLPVPLEVDPASRLSWYFVAIFCQGKFYPLFAMLFGAGLILQRQRVDNVSGRFVPLYLRRIAVLGAFGLLHGTLLWYGDILFLYALCGLALLPFSKLRGATLIKIGVVIAFGTLVVGAVLMSALGGMEIPDPQDATTTPAGPPFDTLIQTIEDDGLEGPTDPRWMALEARAYREGGYGQITGFRVLSFGLMTMMAVLGGGWLVLAVFFLGAGLMKLGFFETDRDRLRYRSLVAGFAIGLPLSALGVSSLGLLPGLGGMLVWHALLVVAGPLLGLGYLSAASLLAYRAPTSSLTTALAATGRLALTHYIGQSVVMSLIMYPWGLGLFGQTTMAERTMLVPVIFLGQVLCSVVWLRSFRFGPLEWIWRSLTYGKRQPMRR